MFTSYDLGIPASERLAALKAAIDEEVNSVGAALRNTFMKRFHIFLYETQNLAYLETISLTIQYFKSNQSKLIKRTVY